MIKNQTLKNFQIIEKIGKGSFCDVYKVIRISDGKTYALKSISIQKLKKKELSNALNEIRILASVDSAYVVKFREAYLDQINKNLCLVMDFASDGDLSNLIKNLS